MPSFWRVAALALYIGCAVYALWLSIAAPLHDWDANGYIAAAESLESRDIQSVLLLQNPERRRLIAAALGASIAIYAGIVTYAGNGVGRHFSIARRCNAAYTLFPIHRRCTSSITSNALSTSLSYLIVDTRFLSFVMLASCAFWIWRTCEHFSRSSAAILLAASVICIVARFLILPAEWELAFPAPYLLTAITLFALIGQRSWKKKNAQ